MLWDLILNILNLIFSILICCIGFGIITIIIAITVVFVYSIIKACKKH